MTDVIIIGAGLSGLSTAYFLKGRAHIFEKSNAVGGLCRTYPLGAYRFDITGHLIHGLLPDDLDFLKGLLPVKIKAHKRRASVFYKNTLVPYPFQANLHMLSPEDEEICLKGLSDLEKSKMVEKGGGNLKQWFYNTFGRGIAESFMIPYNEKVWGVKAELMTADWVKNRVPMPSLEDIKKTRDGSKKAWGYNALFYYPEEGGIGVLPDALAGYCQGLHLEKEVLSIDLEKRRCILDDGTVFPYAFLVSTMPIPDLIRRLRPENDSLIELSKKLRWRGVWDINMGVRAEKLSDQHWIYFPEKEFIFYRVGFPKNFSPSSVPEGASSLYIEISHAPGEVLNKERVIERAVGDLLKTGILSKDHTIDCIDLVEIPFAYVIYDNERNGALNSIIDFLKGFNIYTIGRFGGWGYTSMWETIQEARNTARYIMGLQDEA